MTEIADGGTNPTDADLGPDLSRRLTEVVRQETRRVGLLVQDLPPDVALLVQRVAIRSAYEGTTHLVAELKHHGVDIDLAATVIDEAGEDLLLPPLES